MRKLKISQIIKKIKLFSLLALFALAAGSVFIFAKRPADDKPETIMVRVNRYGFLVKSEVNIYYGGDKVENSEFKAKELDQSLIGIIQKLNADGYKVVSQSYCVVPSGGNNNLAIKSDVSEVWVLTKK